MAKRIKSGLKRRRQNEVRRLRNRAARTQVRHAIKDLRASIADGDSSAAQELLPRTISIIDSGVSKGIYHRNTAARLKSRLSQQVGALARGASE